MENHSTICTKIENIFVNDLSVEVPSRGTDLVDTGLMDSLIFVDLLLNLEQDFLIEVSLDDTEIDDFRTIDSIASFVERKNGVLIEKRP